MEFDQDRTIDTPITDEDGRTRVFAASQYEAVTAGLLFRHKVYEAAESDRLFAAQHYVECQQACYDILQAARSYAIQARCHMHLARQEVTPDHAAARAYHAAMATQAWEVVIERTGLSRFPVEQARVQLEVAKKLAEAATRAVLEEDGEA